MQGVAGQGNPNPASLFTNHRVAKIGGVYYDASAGVSHPSLAALESAAIAGYFIVESGEADEADYGVSFNGDADATDEAVPVWRFLFLPNLEGNQLVEWDLFDH